MVEDKEATAVEQNGDESEKVVAAPQDASPEGTGDMNELDPEDQATRQAKLEERAINEATASADSMYVPSPTLLASTSPLPLMEQVDGPSLKKYVTTPNVYMARSVPLAAGMKLEVPIHVSSGGSVVEYTVESEHYDVKLGIIAEREEKETVVKALELVDSHVKPCTGKFLVGTVPCVLIFSFDNTYSWMREKKVTYKVVVTPPSKENIMLGRRRRAAAALKAVEEDLSSAANRLENATKEKDSLTEAVEKLEKELATQKEGLEAVTAEETLLEARVGLRTTQGEMLNGRIATGWEDEEDTN